MSSRTLLLVLALVLLPLAGCLGGPDAPAAEPTDRDASDDLTSSYEIRVQRGGAGTPELGDWFFVELRADADGEVTSFELEVPEDAQVAHPEISDVRAAWIEVAPLIRQEDADAVDGWSMFAFSDVDADSLVYNALVSQRYNLRTRFTPLMTEERTAEPWLRPAFLALTAREGQTLDYVVTARSSEPIPFGFAFRFLKEWPEREDLTNDSHAFVDDMADRGRATVPPTAATGGMYKVASYGEINTAAQGLQFWTNTLEVTSEPMVADLRPTAQARDVRLDYGFDSDRGWGLGLGIWAAENAVLEWAIDAEVHGESVATSGTLVETSLGDGGMVTGYPVYLLTGEGPGAASGRMELSVREFGTYNVLLMTHLDFGETLSELIGEEPPSVAFGYDGLTSERTWTLHEEGPGIRLDHDQASIRFLGGPDTLPR